jgi:hypothetical protein
LEQERDRRGAGAVGDDHQDALTGKIVGIEGLDEHVTGLIPRQGRIHLAPTDKIFLFHF